MPHLPKRVTATIATLGVVLALSATTAAPASAGSFGQHVSSCAQTNGLNANHNPGMHRGITGWDPGHIC